MNRFDVLLAKIQKKLKDYCEFENICPYFDLNQFTCTNKGGSNCGKYRCLEAEKTMNESSKPIDTV